MKFITVAGPPSSGKTSVILHLIRMYQDQNQMVGVVKFDCISPHDEEIYKKRNIPVKVGLAGNLCPDHFFVSNVEDCLQWGIQSGFDLLISESAGLCSRCSPHIRGVYGICVIDMLSGINTPRKIGPMLKLADMVVITKGDIVSQAEREVFSFRVSKANSQAHIVKVNGLTGQGVLDVYQLIGDLSSIETLQDSILRFAMPAALCSYCLGETRIGNSYQIGNSKHMEF